MGVSATAGGPVEWAVIAGAAGALGRVIVDRLWDRGLGIVAVGRTAGNLEEVAGGRDRFVVCVADLEDSEGMARVGAAAPGPVRMVVNSAAGPMGGGVLDVDPEAVLATVDVKVNGTLRLVRALSDRLAEDARIVVIGGNLAYDPIPEASTAGLTNAAVANLIRQLSRALGPRRITCHVIAPGPVWTERLRRLIANTAKGRGVTVDQVLAEFRARSPIGHLVTPEEVAWAVEVLLAPEARAIAGGTLILDAGQRTAIP
jgi:NAD(P)-dependent dehydrogenase (short-subunit alcohol dehydrogenase family)